MNESKKVKARIVTKTNPSSLGDRIIGQVGREYMLEIDGQPVPGVLSQRIDFTPNDIATLTVTMVLPEIVYLDDENE